ncbi:hypothetical protein VM1G_12035 [Cytospora mali]|uniref:Uncharacterized protein n=1 Tax=Cytospora mali TaxID=578113 RepID=A0A194VJ63_CYTMA|nr:hypothetical protein VM1G_12035 [Valsa mali]
MKTTAFFAFIGAATALVVRTPGIAGGLGGANTLIEYQRWCPVCDTVERNQACISKRASCQGSTLVIVGQCSPEDQCYRTPMLVFMWLMQRNSVPDSAAECSEYCSSNCQLSYVANSDYGYSCNTTLSTLSI